MDRQLLVSLSKKYGSPLYVYDADTIIWQYNRLSEAFSTVENLKLNYNRSRIPVNKVITVKMENERLIDILRYIHNMKNINILG